MTDELDGADQEATSRSGPTPDEGPTPAPTDEQVVGAYLGADVQGIAATESSIAASLPSVNDINLENAEKAAKWGWHKLFGHDDPPVQAEVPVIDIEDHEETTMRSSTVAHEDPPPPPPQPEHPAPHEAPPKR